MGNRSQYYLLTSMYSKWASTGISNTFRLMQRLRSNRNQNRKPRCEYGTWGTRKRLPALFRSLRTSSDPNPALKRAPDRISLTVQGPSRTFAPSRKNHMACVACGKALRPEDQFCIACRIPCPRALRPAHLPASPRQWCRIQYHPRLRTATPLPPKRRSHTLRNMSLVALVVVIAVVAFLLLSRTGPEDSLKKAGTAYLQHDAQAFDTYVDLQSVLGDWTDQLPAV